jgi:hypothetical protein
MDMPRRKLTEKQREMLGLASEVVLLLVLIAGGTLAYNQRHVTHTVTTNTVVVAGSPVPGASPTPTTVIDTETAVAFYSGKHVSMTVPKAWRTVDVRNAVTSAADPYSATTNDSMAYWRFVPDHPERGTLYSPVEPINQLDVFSVEHWVKTDEGAPATAQNKQAYLNWLESLKTPADITATHCTSISIEGSTCADAKSKPLIIKTADGSLSGLAYLNMQNQSVSYDPRVVVDLVGTVGGKTVRALGLFQIYDQAYDTLGGSGAHAATSASDYSARVMAARRTFSDNPPADTMAEYQRIVTAVQSLRFDPK